MTIRRRKTRQVSIGDVKVGGNAPVSIQSMVKVKTQDVKAALAQIKSQCNAGCHITRIAVKDKSDIAPLAKIVKSSALPIVADIHFNYKLALSAIDAGVDAIRLNPGNIYKEDEVRKVIKKAKKAKIPIRIGANSGSLRAKKKSHSEAEAMIKNVLDYIKHFEEEKFYDIIISLKSSHVLSTIFAYKRLAIMCKYPFHLGVTATGTKEDGIIKSAIGIGSLLTQGIGDTIRVSLTSDPVDEVRAAKAILESCDLGSFGPKIISCPTCGRCQVDIEKTVDRLKKKLVTKRPVTIAVMGCEVNGPGEARDAYVGIAAGKGSGALFKKGKIVKRIKEKDFVKEIMRSL